MPSGPGPGRCAGHRELAKTFTSQDTARMHWKVPAKIMLGMTKMAASRMPVTDMPHAIGHRVTSMRAQPRDGSPLRCAFKDLSVDSQKSMPLSSDSTRSCDESTVVRTVEATSRRRHTRKQRNALRAGERPARLHFSQNAVVRYEGLHTNTDAMTKRYQTECTLDTQVVNDLPPSPHTTLERCPSPHAAFVTGSRSLESASPVKTRVANKPPERDIMPKPRRMLRV
mmetsp:Transcript_15757/g.34152  ORF Transcript_15757/g.34152 Transcript_15757/m.34152 type:complete len:226 (-) Transcript_15757:793-1470(-)